MKIMLTPTLVARDALDGHNSLDCPSSARPALDRFFHCLSRTMNVETYLFLIVTIFSDPIRRDHLQDVGLDRVDPSSFPSLLSFLKVFAFNSCFPYFYVKTLTLLLCVSGLLIRLLVGL